MMQMLLFFGFCLLPLKAFAEDSTVNSEDLLVVSVDIFHLNNTPYTGPMVDYHSNGQKKSEGRFQQGKKQGLFLTWDNKETFLNEETFEDGVLIESIDTILMNEEDAQGEPPEPTPLKHLHNQKQLSVLLYHLLKQPLMVPYINHRLMQSSKET